MKKHTVIAPLFALSFLLSAISGKAQTDTAKSIPATEDYFIGKWKAMIMGIPQGDTEVAISFEKKDGKLTGSMLDPKQNSTSVFEDVKVLDGVLTTNFTAQGYNVDLALKRKDSLNFAGTMMQQFEVTGARIK